MKRRQTRAWKQRAAGLARLGLLCCAAFAAVALFTYRKAEARVGEMLLGFGDEIAGWEGARARPDVRSLYFNGAEFRVATVFFEEELNSVLDRFEAHCDKLGGVHLGEPHGTVATPTIRYQSDERGVVGCLDMEGPQSLAELGQRLEKFVDSTDLKDVGGLRYAHARQGEKGTSVLLLWTERELNLQKMFPKEGDAPGVEPQGVAIPSGSRRTVSTREEGKPYSVNVYELPQSEKLTDKESRIQFLERATRDGWDVTHLGPGVMSLRKGDRVLQAHFSQKNASLSLIELR